MPTTKCFASNQAINNGDGCRVIPIMQGSSYDTMEVDLDGNSHLLSGIANTNVYADCFWRPYGEWLPAIYDEEPEIILSDKGRSSLASLFYELLHRSAVTAEGDNPTHRPGFNFVEVMENRAPGLLAVFAAAQKENRYQSAIEISSGEYDKELTSVWLVVLHAAHCNRIFVRNNSGQPRPVQFAIVHERAFQALIRRVSEYEDYEPTKYLESKIANARSEAERRHSDDLQREEPSRDMRDFFFADVLAQSTSSLDQSGSYPNYMVTKLIRKLAGQLYKGAVSQNELTSKLMPYMLDRYAVAGLDSMCLHFAPMVSMRDSRNMLGGAYASFVQDVSKNVSRDLLERQFGPFNPLSAHVVSEQDFNIATSNIAEYDAAIADVSFDAKTGKIEFLCTMDAKHFAKYLNEVENGKGIKLIVSEPEIEPKPPSRRNPKP